MQSLTSACASSAKSLVLMNHSSIRVQSIAAQCTLVCVLICSHCKMKDLVWKGIAKHCKLSVGSILSKIDVSCQVAAMLSAHARMICDILYHFDISSVDFATGTS